MEEPKRRTRRRLPPPQAGRGRWAQRGLGCRSGGWGPASEELRSRPQAGAAAGRHLDNGVTPLKPLRELKTLRPSSRAPAPSRSPPPCLTHPPGPLEPRPSQRSSSSSSHSPSGPGPPAVRRPCSLQGESSFSGSPYTHISHTHTSPVAAPPPPLGPSLLANAAVGGGLMSLQHHAAAAEEGESYTRTEKHSS